MISPAADDAWRQTVLCQILNPQIRHIEVSRIDACVIFLPRIPGFVGAAWIEGRHVGIQPGHNLNHRKTFAHAIRGERSNVRRPAEATAERHPPRVAEPEERRAIGVLKMQAVRGDAYRTMPVEGIVT